MRPSTTCALILLVLASLGCDSLRESPPDPLDIRQEPIGQLIEVSSDLLRYLPTWHVSESAQTTIGSGAGESPYLFDGILFASQFGDAHILVADGRSRELRVFDSRGRFLRTFGGRGAGPGEFNAMETFSRVNSYLMSIVDPVLKRTTTYDLRTGTVLVERYPNPPCNIEEGDLESWRCDVFGVFPAGGLLVGRTKRTSSRRLPVGQIVIRPAVERSLSVLTNGRFKDIGSIPTHTLISYQGRQVGMNVPYFVTEAMFGLKGFIAVGTERVALARNDRFEIRQWDMHGLPISTIRVGIKPSPVTSEVLRPYKIWADTAESGIKEAREYVKGIEAQGAIPFFSDFVVDRDGRFWLQEYQAPAAIGPRSPQKWIIMDKDGQPVARIENAHVGGILECGDNYVLIHSTDDSGIERVVKYRIETGF